MLPVHEFDLGFRARIKYRPFTLDEDLVKAILIERKEYQLFIGCNPRVIFDIGAQIGCTSILFANSYPNALIYAFEPEPDNFELLVENTKAYDNVKPFKVALGSTTGRRKLQASDDEYNLGGFSFHDVGVDPTKHQMVEVIDICDFVRNERGLKIDLLKVDTEGCEFEILSALKNADMLPDFMLGEAHGVNDWKLFDMLSETHDLQMSKRLEQRCFEFYATRKRPCQNLKGS